MITLVIKVGVNIFKMKTKTSVQQGRMKCPKNKACNKYIGI